METSDVVTRSVNLGGENMSSNFCLETRSLYLFIFVLLKNHKRITRYTGRDLPPAVSISKHLQLSGPGQSKSGTGSSVWVFQWVAGIQVLGSSPAASQGCISRKLGSGGDLGLESTLWYTVQVS